MDKNEYFLVKKEMDLLMEDFRKDALKHNMNLLSKEYKDAKDEVKGKLLEKSGYNPSEFFAMERTYGDGTSLIEEAKEKKWKVETLAKRIMDRIKGKKNE